MCGRWISFSVRSVRQQPPVQRTRGIATATATEHSSRESRRHIVCRAAVMDKAEAAPSTSNPLLAVSAR